MSSTLARYAAGRRPAFPRAALLVGWSLVASALAYAAYGSYTGMATGGGGAEVVASRTLQFGDRADGAVVITEAGTGAIVDVERGQAGFLRGTLRGFARTRRESGVGPALPMVLTAYADGRLVLFDPATRRYVDLEAFGADNEAVFSRLLKLEPPVRGGQP